MATARQIREALAAQIQTGLGGTANPVVEHLTVDSRMGFNPTPPYIDIYPSDPFVERSSMGRWDMFFTVRVRVTTADHAAGQDLLDSFMDPRATTSLTRVIESDDTLGGMVEECLVAEGPSGYGRFNDPGSVDNALLGAIWRVQVIP